MARTVDQKKKLEQLKERLDKALAVKKRTDEKIATYRREIDMLENAKKVEVVQQIINNPETAKALFELGIITEEQFNSLSPKKDQVKHPESDQLTQ